MQIYIVLGLQVSSKESSGIAFVCHVHICHVAISLHTSVLILFIRNVLRLIRDTLWIFIPSLVAAQSQFPSED